MNKNVKGRRLPDTGEECCCHESKEETKSADSCCHSEQNAETNKSCCHGKTKETESSCCHGEQNAETNKSCCQEKTKGTESSCCHGGKQKKQSVEGCCGSLSVAPKPSRREPVGSCCGGMHTSSDKPGEEGGCCGKTRKKGSGFWGKYGDFFILGISLAALVVSFISPFRNHPVMKYLDFGWIAVILCGIPIFVNAFRALSRKKITSALLISMSITACIVLEILMLTNVLPHGDHGHSNIFAAGEVAWLMALGGLIEGFTVKKARAGIENLVRLSPTTAKYRVNGKIIEKPLSEVKIGDLVTVLPGDMISVDGEIVGGRTSVDESVMTGESLPVDKADGDKVYGGTWNKEGAIEVRVTKAEDDMAINKLKKLVAEAEGKKAPISKLADRWAGYIVPAALLFSAAIFLITFFAMNVPLASSVERAVTMLVVFCPCALALATPTAVAAGLGNATKKGILIKSGGALESLAHVKTAAFDKTGTLTAGRIEVTDMITFGVSKERLAFLAGSAESSSEHPLAKAVTAYCAPIAKLAVPEVAEGLVGRGVRATVDGTEVTVEKWSGEAGDATRLLSEGKTVTVVKENGKLIGLIALSDVIRDGSAECVEDLSKLGIKSVMLTGDNASAAGAIAGKLGLTSFSHSLLPGDKLTEIEKLKSGGAVLMVGDGVNDAPALAAADCSLAMGALGSDAAIETADAALMSDDIRKIPALIRLARRVLGTIKANITLSMAINLAAVVLSTLGLLNPITGALVHNISSVLVVCNSALILRHNQRANNRAKKIP